MTTQQLINELHRFKEHRDKGRAKIQGRKLNNQELEDIQQELSGNYHEENIVCLF